MSLPQRSKFVFGGSEFVCTLSAQPWTPGDSSVGGMRVAASGVPASYTVRRDALVDLTIRIWESEWTALLNLIHWGQTSQVITWHPDADDDDVAWDCYLDAPAAGERFSPTRLGEFQRVMEVNLTLRGAGSAVPWTTYFGTD